MKKRQAGILTAVLCVLLAGCSVTQSPSADLSAGPPASAAQTETPANPVKADAPPEEEPAPQGIADVYVGEWQDAEDGPSGGQCRLSIDCGANGIYGIDIRWDDSRWRFTGTYDEIWEGIDYIGARYSEQTLDGGEVQSTAVLEEETGMLYLDEGGVLQWEDTFEHMGENMKFGRVS